MRNAFSRNGFVFDRNFFEILKISRSRTPEDLVLEWFRRHNVPDGQVKVGIHRSEVQQQAHLRSRQLFLASGAFKVARGFDILVFGRSCGVTTALVVCEISLRGVCFRSKFLATENAARGLFSNRISRNIYLWQLPGAHV